MDEIPLMYKLIRIALYVGARVSDTVVCAQIGCRRAHTREHTRIVIASTDAHNSTHNASHIKLYSSI